MKIKELREKLRLSQMGFASVLGVSQSAVAKWETGESNPSFKQLIKLKNLFGISLDELLREDGEPNGTRT